jgi:hypothetical protein
MLRDYVYYVYYVYYVLRTQEKTRNVIPLCSEGEAFHPNRIDVWS